MTKLGVSGFIVVTFLAALGALLIPRPAAPEPHAPAAALQGCDWQAEWHGTLGELGEDPAAWSLADSAELEGNAGVAWMDTLTVLVSRDVPCRYLGDVIRHEWMHLQQGRMHGGWGAYEHYGARLEIVADCGSWLLGSAYTPYRDDARTVAFGCTMQDLADARELIRFRSTDG
ncbi:hypothetical protein [Prauserella muralis]|uniref:Uncharacterized protein n=1 Tax=Prauserella muralis TaxID=588067 RepID=A0A2V4BCV8_9PSEU|nr:hypothetical protein [Prauserella muralis]PXY27449.1 hypothetical protein BAY60_13530 [Prauserella muralis]TWE22850.1 hypothetical protein FHX69_4105 [Prauserella muralis]